MPRAARPLVRSFVRGHKGITKDYTKILLSSYHVVCIALTGARMRMYIYTPVSPTNF